MIFFVFLISKMLSTFASNCHAVVWVDYERDFHAFTRRRLVPPPT